MRWMAAAGCAVLLLWAPIALAVDEPIGKLDYTRLVGRPLLEDPKTPPGIYVWVHAGWVNFGAVGAKGKGRTTYSLRVTTTKSVKRSQLGRFKKSARSGRTFTLTVSVSDAPVRGRIQTDGELTLSDPRAGAHGAHLYLGPAGRRAARTVKVSRK